MQTQCSLKYSIFGVMCFVLYCIHIFCVCKLKQATTKWESTVNKYESKLEKKIMLAHVRVRERTGRFQRAPDPLITKSSDGTLASN